MPPVSVAPWNGVRLAHSAAPVCPQNIPPKSYSNQNDLHNSAPRSHWRQLEMSNIQRLLRNQSEDCLYLNIYSPLGKCLSDLTFLDQFHWSEGQPLERKTVSLSWITQQNQKSLVNVALHSLPLCFRSSNCLHTKRWQFDCFWTFYGYRRTHCLKTLSESLSEQHAVC